MLSGTIPRSVTTQPRDFKSPNIFYKDKLKIEIVLDNSDISNFIESKLLIKNVDIIKPENLEILSNTVAKVDFGIFMDSGPLHLAKLLKKAGILIVTSVDHK